MMPAGCAGDVDPAHYGPAGGLRNLQPRTDSGDGGSVAPPAGGDSGGNTSTACGGKGVIDGGSCAIKWSVNIYPKMQPTGAWKCTDTAACHGGKNSGVVPFIDSTSSHNAYTQLVAYVSSTNGNKPYIDPCSTSSSDSTFVCNVQAATPCGLLGMPSLTATPGAAALTAQEQADLLTWVQCGSPEN